MRKGKLATFFRDPIIRVNTVIEQSKKCPKVITRNNTEDRLNALRLSKAGYGSVEEILNMPVDIVLDILSYETFLSEFEVACYELNKKEGDA